MASSATRPARTTARVLELLERLQSGGIHRVADLAVRLGVDERTVRRDVARLLELDVPVRTVRGRYGGYRIEPGYRLPPLMFTDDEAVALLLRLTSAGVTGEDHDGDDAAARAMAKLRRVLPALLVERLDAVAGTVHVVATGRPEPSVTLARSVADSHARTVMVLAEAARDRRPVVFDHADRSGQRRERHVHPFAIVALDGRLYLVGFDVDRDAQRTYRLDRIRHPSPRPGSFGLPADFDPVSAVQATLAHTPWRHEVVLRVQSGREQVHAVLPRRIAIVDDEAPEPGWIRVRLHVENLDWLPAVLARLQRPFVIDAPAELRTRMRVLATRLAAAAS